jgi:hypothetical protein
VNPLAVIAYLREHWRGCTVAAAILAAFVAGYRLHARLNPPVACAPAITMASTEHKDQTVDAKKDVVVDTGPKHKVTINFDPSTATSGPRSSTVVPGLDRPVDVPAGERIESVTIEDDGPSKKETKAATETRTDQTRAVDLTVRPAPSTVSPRLELEAGIEDVFDARRVRVEGRVRVSDRLWFGASTRPAEWIAGRKDLGLSLSCSF